MSRVTTTCSHATFVILTIWLTAAAKCQCQVSAFTGPQYSIHECKLQHCVDLNWLDRSSPPNPSDNPT